MIEAEAPEALTARIRELRARRNAVILAHNYQPGDVQDVADFVGDSLQLTRRAADTAADVIVFCGVHFMAETAAILCPGRTVLLPDQNAGCPMADMADGRELAMLKQRHPHAAVVTYVNSSAAVKALSDVCCTSANAEAVVRSIPADRPIIFVPDRNLGANVARATGRAMILWNGFCPSHERIAPGMVDAARAAHPGAAVLVHPECRPEVVLRADAARSTAGMLDFAQSTPAQTVVVGTEPGMLHQLRKHAPDKTFVPLTTVSDCPDMRLTTLRKIVWALEDRTPIITVDAAVAAAADRAIRRMLEVAG